MKAIFAILVVVAIAAAICIPVLTIAAADPPDSDPSVTIDIYDDQLETGDMLFLAYANIPYATTPDDPVTSTYIWNLIDTDGTTVLGSTTGYAFNDNGYGYNVYSLYFSAAEVTSLGLIWDTNYTLRLIGNPAAFADPPVYNFAINSADYNDDPDDLGPRIMVIAADLNNLWGLTTDYYLTAEYESATVLSIYGESYFRGAIYGLQGMAPEIFGVIIRAINIEDRTWSDNYTAAITDQYSGTWAETAREADKALFGATYSIGSVMIMLALFIGVIIANIMVGADFWSGMMDGSIVAIIGAKLALYDFMFLLLMAALILIYVASRIWFRLFR